MSKKLTKKQIIILIVITIILGILIIHIQKEKHFYASFSAVVAAVAPSPTAVVN